MEDLSEWKKKYYPVTAKDCILHAAENNKTEEERTLIAIDHTILKYTGTQPKILSAYGLYKDKHVLHSKPYKSATFAFGYDCCALCVLTTYPFPTDEYFITEYVDCKKCIITQYQGSSCIENLYSPWALDKLSTNAVLRFLRKLKKWYGKEVSE